MKQSYYLLFILPLFLFSSCEPEGRVYTDHKELSPDIEWKKEDVRSFEVPINDNSVAYDLSLSFRFANGYQYEIAKVKVTEVSPGGATSEKEYDLIVRDENGEFIGEAGYDIWDSEHLIEPNKKFEETGTYSYTIEHMMPKDPLYFAMEIGVVLDKAK